ncbi:EcsC family protein [Serinibacter arcticus]|nr:EcsC family protein [Serinibacter arcticus]
MGLFSKGRSGRKSGAGDESALTAAGTAAPENGVTARVVRTITDLGLDGRGPFCSARAVADSALKRADGDVDRAIRAVTKSATRGGAAGGVVTGVGGFATMPVALPANLVEFYVQATRLVGAIATLRGYDVSEQQIRTAVVLTLVGSDAEDVLRRAGISTGTGRVTALALRRLPASSMMMVNKAIGFRLLRGVAERFLTRLGRLVPLAGGAVGGVLDAWMMRRIAANARRQFPTTA